MKIMVTGGAGFLGSHVVDQLESIGIPTLTIDNLSTGRRENASEKTEFIESACEDIFQDTFRDVSVVIHLACQPRCNVSIFSPEEDVFINYIPGLKFFKKCFQTSVKRIVFVSSMSVYGESSLPYREEMNVCPRDPYAIHKWALERILLLEGKLHNIEVVIVRPQHVFGPRQRPDLSYRNVIARWIRRAYNQHPLPIIGSTELRRAFSPVSLVARGIVAAALQPEISGEIFNLGSMNVRSLEEIISKIQNLLNLPVDVQHLPAPQTLLLNAYGSVEKAQNILGVIEEDSEFDRNFLALAKEIQINLSDSSEISIHPEVRVDSFSEIYLPDLGTAKKCGKR